MSETKYWRISPGEKGYLWREQKLNECIALGWSETGNLKGRSRAWLRDKLKILKWPGRRAYSQLEDFVWTMQRGDKIIASTSGRGIYAMGTVIGDYEFNPNLEYKHSRKVNWDTTFWHPVDIEDDLRLNPNASQVARRLYYKCHGQTSQTIRRMEPEEWNYLLEELREVRTPFRNLAMWGGLIQSPEYENEVMILFSHMLQHLRMRIVGFQTRFPDAIVEQKKNGRWKRVNVEFELYSSGFVDHLDFCNEKRCNTIVCWEDDWKDRIRRKFKIIELKHELEKIL